MLELSNLDENMRDAWVKVETNQVQVGQVRIQAEYSVCKEMPIDARRQKSVYIHTHAWLCKQLTPCPNSKKRSGLIEGTSP